MNKFKRDLDDSVGESPRFKEPLKRKILSGMKEEKRPTFRFVDLKYAAVLMLLLTVATIFLVLNLNGDNMDSPDPAGTTDDLPALTDTDTVEGIETFTEYEAPLEIYDFRYDAMDRGNHDYYEHPLLIDPTAYPAKEVDRGDVVVYEAEFFNGKNRTVGRVVAMPGEEIEVVDGQIYINSRKLETFYGRAHRMGNSSSEEFVKWFEENTSSKSTTTGMEELFQTDMKKVHLAENEVFVVGDDWFRGHMTKLAISEIEAKVLGYYTEEYGAENTSAETEGAESLTPLQWINYEGDKYEIFQVLSEKDIEEFELNPTGMYTGEGDGFVAGKEIFYSEKDGSIFAVDDTGPTVEWANFRK